MEPDDYTIKIGDINANAIAIDSNIISDVYFDSFNNTISIGGNHDWIQISDIDIMGLFYFEDHNCYQSIDKYNKSLICRIHFVIRQFIFA